MITRKTTPLNNDTRRALWAARYYGSGLHRCGTDDRHSLRIDHGEDDPIPFALDGAPTEPDMTETPR